MKNFRTVVSLFVIFIFVGTWCAAGEAKKAKGKNENPTLALYKDKVRFQMLSGAMQSALEMKYGKKQTKNAVVSEDGQDRQLSPNTAIPNVLANNPAADATNKDTQSETTIVLAGSNIVVGFNDSGSFLGGAAHFTGSSHSTDGGSTFTDHGQLPNDPSGEGDAGDPVLARNNTTGRVYLTTLGFNTLGKLQVYRSDDNGQTFMTPVGFAATGGSDQQDKEWIAVDNFGGGGQGNVYVVWRSFGTGIYITRSTDHGSTWSAPAKLADEGSWNVQGAFVAVAPDHSVHVFWLDQSAGNGTANKIRTRKSTDQGVTFAAFVPVANLTTTQTNGGLGLNGGFRTNGFPHAAVNPVLGDIYVTWNDDVTGLDKSDIFMTMSTDGGATWATPSNISDLFDSTTRDDYMPTLGVTPDGTKVMFSWYDRQGNAVSIDRYGAIANATSGNLSFGPQFRISDSNWPVVIGQDPVINSVYMGDYDHLDADNNFFYVTWGDNRSGNAFHAHQPDVRFAKIPVAGPGAILFSAGVTTDDSAGNNDGDIDFNECIGLNANLTNQGTSTATGVTSTLSTSTPNVTITQNTSSYADIAPGATMPNTTAFQFETSPSFACGTVINFTLTISTATDGPFVINFSVVDPPPCADGGGPCGPTPPTCAFFDAFNDATVTWNIIKDAWAEIIENLVGTPANRKAIIETPAAFVPCDVCTIETHISTDTEIGSKFWVYTHRIDKRTQVEILFKAESNKIIIKIKRLGVLLVKAKVTFVIDANVVYDVIAAYDGTTYTLSVDGTPLFAIPISGLQMGKAGYAVKGGSVLVDDFCKNP